MTAEIVLENANHQLQGKFLSSGSLVLANSRVNKQGNLLEGEM